MSKNNAQHPWQQPWSPNAPAGPKPISAGERERKSAGVPVERLQKAFRESGLSLCEVARRIGWYYEAPNIWLVKQTLGIDAGPGGKRRKEVTYKTAVKFCEALHASPVEMGI